MNNPSPKLGPTFWTGLILCGLTFGALLVWTRLKEWGPALPVYGQVADFSLTNQLGSPVSVASLRGQVWVADVIFSRCPTACLTMTKRMGELQAALPANASVKLLSVTTDPDFDSPEILKRYGEKFAANPDRWWFLTGPKAQVLNALTNGLKLTAVETPPELRTNQFDLFTHSTLFVVVDKQSRIRAAIETMQPEWKKQALGYINRLLREDAE